MRFNPVVLRLVGEGAAIVAAAAIAGPVLHLAWWEVVIVVFLTLAAAYVLESLVERKRPARPPARKALPPSPPVEIPSYVRVLEAQSAQELVLDPVPPPPPEPEPEPEPEPAPEPEPEPVAVAVAAPSAAVSGPPWNIWELERALDESGRADDEKTFMLHYLRDYAASDGTLPPEFDDLVRESFGSVL